MLEQCSASILLRASTAAAAAVCRTCRWATNCRLSVLLSVSVVPLAAIIQNSDVTLGCAFSVQVSLTSRCPSAASVGQHEIFGATNTHTHKCWLLLNFCLQTAISRTTTVGFKFQRIFSDNCNSFYLCCFIKHLFHYYNILTKACFTAQRVIDSLGKPYLVQQRQSVSKLSIKVTLQHTTITFWENVQDSL